jgi:hypothetical protein
MESRRAASLAGLLRSAIDPVAGSKIHPEGVRISLPNQRFRGAPNRPFAALKKGQKSLFIQHVADGDFALGAIHLSWHK